MHKIPATRTTPPLRQFEIKNRGRRVGDKMLKCLAWRPIQGLPHACPRHWQEPQLACVHRALTSLHSSNCSRDWSWGAYLLFSLQSPGTPISCQTCFIIYIKHNKNRFVCDFVFLRADKTTLNQSPPIAPWSLLRLSTLFVVYLIGAWD